MDIVLTKKRRGCGWCIREKLDWRGKLKMGDLEEAKDCIMQALQRKNKNPGFIYNMGMVEMVLLVIPFSILNVTAFVRDHL